MTEPRTDEERAREIVGLTMGGVSDSWRGEAVRMMVRAISSARRSGWEDAVSALAQTIADLGDSEDLIGCDGNAMLEAVLGRITQFRENAAYDRKHFPEPLAAPEFHAEIESALSADAPDPATAPIEDVRAELKRRGIDTTKAVETVLEAVHKNDPEPGRVYWFAEVDPIESPARYLVRGAPGVPAHLTTDPLKAARFETRDECLAACVGSAVRVLIPERLVPREHMFVTPLCERRGGEV